MEFVENGMIDIYLFLSSYDLQKEMFITIDLQISVRISHYEG
jgi:hypothetical protein